MSGVPSAWIKVELQNFSLFHPTGKENFWKMCDEAIAIHAFNLKADLESNQLLNSGGIYFIWTSCGRYIGETLNFYNRFNQHLEDLKSEKHYNKKLAEGLKNGKDICFFILELGVPTEINKAEFKLYCLKRENYYIELFSEWTKNVINIEDTLKQFYIGFGKMFKLDESLEGNESWSRSRYEEEFFITSKSRRPKSMKDLEKYKKVNPKVNLEDEQEKYKIIQEILANRKNK